MKLNRAEYFLMNNPLRALLQRRVEAKRFLDMGGPVRGGRALEIGCGQGVGLELILELFGAATVEGFDLDPRMVALARRRTKQYDSRVRLWVGDATSIPMPDASYDAVFDFGIIHHVPDWRRALREISRVLRPGGRFYAEEMLRSILVHPVIRRILDHPQEDRFEAPDFVSGLRDAGFAHIDSYVPGRIYAWFTASKPGTN